MPTTPDNGPIVVAIAETAVGNDESVCEVVGEEKESPKWFER